MFSLYILENVSVCIGVFRVQSKIYDNSDICCSHPLAYEVSILSILDDGHVTSVYHILKQLWFITVLNLFTLILI